MPIAQAEIVTNLRNSAVCVRELNPDMAHRYELRADAVERGQPFPELHGYVEVCDDCGGDGWTMQFDGPVVCRPCQGRGEFGSPQFTSGD